MEINFKEAFDYAKAFENTGLGKICSVIGDLAFERYQQIREGITAEKPVNSEVYTLGEAAKRFKVCTRTFKRNCERFGITPDWGEGKSTRFTAKTLDRYESAMLKARG